MAIRPVNPKAKEGQGQAWGDIADPYAEKPKPAATPASLLPLPSLRTATSERYDGLTDFRLEDPGLYAEYQNVVGALRSGILPPEAITYLTEAFPESLRRELVYRWSSMEKSILVSLKEQLTVVDTIIQSFMTDDGGVVSGTRNGMTAKDAVNMSMKLASIFAQHLPKLVKADKVQRMENALFKVVETSLTPEQKQKVLAELEEMDRLANRD